MNVVKFSHSVIIYLIFLVTRGNIVTAFSGRDPSGGHFCFVRFLVLFLDPVQWIRYFSKHFGQKSRASEGWTFQHNTHSGNQDHAVQNDYARQYNVQNSTLLNVWGLISKRSSLTLTQLWNLGKNKDRKHSFLKFITSFYLVVIRDEMSLLRFDQSVRYES